VAAGYVLYGSSTMMVFTTGEGVHGFTYDPTAGEFLLSHTNIRIPRKGQIYSVNEGNCAKWSPGVQAYVSYLKETDKETHRPYSLRYVGSLVADFHRTLLYGGIFMYPGEAGRPQGKLRIVYEAAPLGFLVEQAGGRAVNDRALIHDVQPATLHDRTPLYIGSEEDVRQLETFLAQPGKN
jgi:fructose-1,6-bisphosphatase I